MKGARDAQGNRKPKALAQSKYSIFRTVLVYSHKDSRSNSLTSSHFHDFASINTFLLVSLSKMNISGIPSIKEDLYNTIVMASRSWLKTLQAQSQKYRGWSGDSGSSGSVTPPVCVSSCVMHNQLTNLKCSTQWKFIFRQVIALDACHMANLS